MLELECTDNPSPPRWQRRERRTRTRSVRTAMPTSLQLRREKLCHDAKVNLMTSLFTALPSFNQAHLCEVLGIQEAKIGGAAVQG
jgi:hypothetical protein